MSKKEIPNLHQQAMVFKNRRRFQHDGGRAWIKDSQLHDAIKGMRERFETVKKDPPAGK